MNTHLWSESKRTSNDAHDSVKEHLPKMKDQVLSVISTRESTDDELEIITGMSHQSLSACRRGLVKDGLVEASGKKRPTRSGRAAQVWRRAWIMSSTE
jgi:predicted transcriptional regulator